MILNPSQQFGRYRIEKKIGHGGMGSVYLARDATLDRRVALKTILSEGSPRPETIERFYREARAAATLHHPNLCPVYDAGEIDGVHFLTMAFIEGEPLAARVEGGKTLDPRDAAALVRKLALGLAEAHEKGVIHRDLKPANIMIGRKGEPVVVNFGLARRDQPGEADLTVTGSFLGTRTYASPEQWRLQPKDVTASTDIYSLGVLLYRLLTGRVPFLGPSVESLMYQVLMESPQPPSALRPGLDPRLDAICLKAIARSPADRFASMLGFAGALEDYLGTEGPASHGLTTQVPGVNGPTVIEVEPPGWSPKPKPPGPDTFAGAIREDRRPTPSLRPWAVGFGCLAALLILAAILVTSSREQVATVEGDGSSSVGSAGGPRETSGLPPRAEKGRIGSETDEDAGRVVSSPEPAPAALTIPGRASIVTDRGDLLGVVREYPYHGSEITASVRAGQVVRVIQRSKMAGDFLQIEDEHGRQIGWIPEEYLVPLPSSPSH